MSSISSRLLVGGLIASLAANVALIALTPRSPERPTAEAALAPPPLRDSSDRSTASNAGDATAALSPPATSADLSGGATVRRWDAVHSSDLDTFVANLRAAGFPETLVKGAVTALLDEAMTEKRRALFGGLAEPDYWQPRISPMYTPDVYAKQRELYRERQEELERLFGASFGDEDYVAYARRELGFLNDDKIAMISRIERDYQDLESQIQISGITGRLPEDAEKLALLRQEKARDIADLLTPEEQETYDLHRSTTARSLRSQFGMFEPTEQEFRDIYALRRTFDERFDPSLPTVGPTAAEERMAAQKELDAQVKSILGDERYAEYERGRDRGYQTAVRIVDHFKLPTENAIAVFELQKAAEEQQRLPPAGGSDTAAVAAATRTLLQETTGKLTTLLTAEGFEAYKQSSGFWVRNLENRLQSAENAARRAQEQKQTSASGGTRP